MPSLRRVPFTKPLPAGAEIFTRKGKLFARWIDGKDRPREAEVTEDGTRIRQLSRKWYGSFTDADGVERCIPLATDKTAAGQMLAELVRKAELGKAGIVDPFAEHRKRPLREHVADYEAYLLDKGDDSRHVAVVGPRLKALIDGCRFIFMADVSASAVMDYLASLRRDRPAAPLPDGKEWFSPREAAVLLGIKAASVGTAVRRHRLAAEGLGKARRYPRVTVEALHDRLCRGASVETTNQYLGHA